MSFPVSPGVVVREIDRTASIAGASTSIGAIVGDFKWGPVGVSRLVSSEDELVSAFGQPKQNSATDFLVASQFLSYSNALRVVRVVDEANALNASDGTPILIKSNDSIEQGGVTLDNGTFFAKYPGELGNSLRVVVVNSSTYDVDSPVGVIGLVSGLFDSAPEAGEVHIAVIDTDGQISGVAGTVLETFAFVGTSEGDVSDDGRNNYAVDVINNRSEFVWLASTADFGSLSVDDSAPVNDGVFDLDGGVSTTPETGDYQSGWDVFENPDNGDVSLLITSSADVATALYAIAIAEARADCVAFVSPQRGDVLGSNTPLEDVLAYREALGANSSYAVMDSGWKQVYNKFAKRYEYVPLNGDIAGLCARTDSVADTWFSPGGLERGAIRNAVKLAWNPSKAQRDELYKVGVNPVVNLPGRGTVLYGDKTLLTRPSAFDRINVRRLFIALRKTISRAAEAQLFEFNDEFTRANFVATVEPFMREVQGRRGVTDFRVVCDETNNTASVINANRFVADIYVRPSRSINFIRLSFIAVPEGVEFSEVVGQ